MKRGTFLSLVQLAAALSLALSTAFVPLGTSAELIWLCLVAFYWCAVKAILSPVTLAPQRPSHLTGELLFLVFAYILLFLPYQLAVVGAMDLWASRFVEFAFVEYTNPSLLASTSGVLAFCAGVRLLPRSGAIGAKAVVESRQYVDAFLILVAVLQLATMGLFGLSGGLSEMAAGAYSGSTTNDRIQDGLYFLVTLFAMLGVSGGLYRRWRFQRHGVMAWVSLTLAVAWAAALILLGDRNSFLLLAVVGIAGCSVFVFRIGPLALAVLLGIGLLGYSVVEESRQATTRDVASLVSAMQSRRDSTFSDSSFTNTTVTSRAALALVPGSYPYFFGKFKIIGIAGVVPYSRGLFVSPNDPFVTSADLISVGVLGSRPTWSLGTNVISDVYVDFGAVGIPLCLFLAGLSLSYVTNRFTKSVPSLKWSVLYLTTVALIAELPRYSFDFPIRPLVWSFLLLTAFGAAWKFLSRSGGGGRKG
jgi:hypothetical protein